MTNFGANLGQNDLLGLTLTADYSLWAAMITRAEIRWDHALNGDRAFSTGTSIPSFAPSDRNALTLALNVIYKF